MTWKAIVSSCGPQRVSTIFGTEYRLLGLERRVFLSSCTGITSMAAAKSAGSTGDSSVGHASVQAPSASDSGLESTSFRPIDMPPFHPVPNLYDFFKGSWYFHRTIEDRFGRPARQPEMNNVVGLATFEPTLPFSDSKTGQVVGDPAESRYLAYLETGLAEFSGSTTKIHIRQTYFFHFVKVNSVKVRPDRPTARVAACLSALRASSCRTT